MRTMKRRIPLFVLFLSFYSVYSAILDFSNIRSVITSAINNEGNLTTFQKEIYSEDGLLNFTELARKYIGTCEEYDVTTEDGYILTLFHIPGNSSSVVLICTGTLITPDGFLVRGNTSLIYAMAKQGFDVWAMSYRGIRYSRRHVKLDPDTDNKFWEFSMHEIGIYDYRVIIDFVLIRTGQEQLSVVAHSEGTSALFVLMSERPEYNSKVKVFAALAPVCYLRHAGPGLTAIIKAGTVVYPTLHRIGIEELLGYSSLEKKAVDLVCSRGLVGYKICFIDIIGPITGFNPANFEPEFVSTILGHFPAGTSRKNLEHYVHVYERNNFVKYDYGLENLVVYGSLKPPAYDLKKVSTKVAMFAGKGDLVAAIQDVERLRRVLPNVVHYHVVEDDQFNHLDYTWGLSAHTVLYPYVIDILRTYN